MPQELPWIIALASLTLLACGMGLWLFRRRKPALKPLPSEWALTARPVFSTDERRVYRQLREALPHQIVLSKLPLVRFCQPTDPQDVRYWYELLGSIHITFAICSANGRVLAAIDLDNDRGNSRRVLQIKQSVLAACRVRYLRCPVDHLPSIPELQLLVPQSAAASRGPQPAPSMTQVRGSRAGTVAGKRRERAALWQDSGFFQDSFFGAETRTDIGGTSQLAGPGSAERSTVGVRELPPDEDPDASGGVIVDTPQPPPPPLRH